MATISTHFQNGFIIPCWLKYPCSTHQKDKLSLLPFWARFKAHWKNCSSLPPCNPPPNTILPSFPQRAASWIPADLSALHSLAYRLQYLFVFGWENQLGIYAPGFTEIPSYFLKLFNHNLRNIQFVQDSNLTQYVGDYFVLVSAYP